MYDTPGYKLVRLLSLLGLRAWVGKLLCWCRGPGPIVPCDFPRLCGSIPPACVIGRASLNEAECESHERLRCGMALVPRNSVQEEVRQSGQQDAERDQSNIATADDRQEGAGSAKVRTGDQHEPRALFNVTPPIGSVCSQPKCFMVKGDDLLAGIRHESFPVRGVAIKIRQFAQVRAHEHSWHHHCCGEALQQRRIVGGLGSSTSLQSTSSDAWQWCDRDIYTIDRLVNKRSPQENHEEDQSAAKEYEDSHADFFRARSSSSEQVGWVVWVVLWVGGCG
jgi:hypothetical protein